MPQNRRTRLARLLAITAEGARRAILSAVFSGCCLFFSKTVYQFIKTLQCRNGALRPVGSSDAAYASADGALHAGSHTWSVCVRVKRTWSTRQSNACCAVVEAAMRVEVADWAQAVALLHASGTCKKRSLAIGAGLARSTTVLVTVCVVRTRNAEFYA